MMRQDGSFRHPDAKKTVVTYLVPKLRLGTRWFLKLCFNILPLSFNYMDWYFAGVILLETELHRSSPEYAWPNGLFWK